MVVNNRTKAEHTSKRRFTRWLCRAKRCVKKLVRKIREKDKGQENINGCKGATIDASISDGRVAEVFTKSDDELLKFVAQVNNAYQETMKKASPFMSFVLCGMESSGKSTIMERFMNAPLNIVQEGTATRCPLDTTCIHDDSCIDPSCDLSGNELEESKTGTKLKVSEVFERITEHNRMLGDQDRFSTEPLRLVYRAKNVQNMRIVDMPGIISNKSTGKDNREEIKMILRSEMRKPNTNLCVLLEPTEFAANPIIQFCDETFNGRDKWISNATSVMTKFDMQLENLHTSSKANEMFKVYHDNNFFPHVIITPRLTKENLPAEELFQARQDLLATTDNFELKKFDLWLEGQKQFCLENIGDEQLADSIRTKIGFSSLKTNMRKIMLKDSIERLPEVVNSIRKELDMCRTEEKALLDKQSFNNPKELQMAVSDIVLCLARQMKSYLDGGPEASLEWSQTLPDEVKEEAKSGWSSKKLNKNAKFEDHWRRCVAKLQGLYPDTVQPGNNLLGDKQVHRAIEFFGAVMREALPSPSKLRDKVSSMTQHVGGGLEPERNWDHAIVEILVECVRNVSHPGINYLVKHIGLIFRRLFHHVLDNMKQGEEHSEIFNLLPDTVEKYLANEFDHMLWGLMENAAQMVHNALEPMYSAVYLNFPAFHAKWFEDENPQEGFAIDDGECVPVPRTNQNSTDGLIEQDNHPVASLASVSAEEVKKHLEQERVPQAKGTLSKQQCTAREHILDQPIEYILPLIKLHQWTVESQISHYLHKGFKTELRECAFRAKLLSNANWNKLAEPDTNVTHRLGVLKEQIAGLSRSLHEVRQMQHFKWNAGKCQMAFK